MAANEQDIHRLLRGPNAELIGTGRVSEAIAQGRSPSRTTPFRDLWQRIAGEIGITTKRMRRGMAEQRLTSLASANGMADSIKTGVSRMAQLGYVTEAEQEELDQLQMAASNAQILAGHPDPNVQARALERLFEIGDASRTFANRIGERANEARDEVMDERRARGQMLVDAKREQNTQAETITRLIMDDIDERSSDALVREETYQMALEFAGTAEGEAGMLASLLSRRSERPTNQEMLRQVSTILSVRNKGFDQGLQQLQTEAEADGQQLNAREGVVTSDDVNVPEPIPPFELTDDERAEVESGSAAREEGLIPSFNDILDFTSNVGEVVGGRRTGEAVRGGLESLGEAAGGIVELPERIQGFARRAAAQAQERQRRRNNADQIP